MRSVDVDPTAAPPTAPEAGGGRDLPLDSHLHTDHVDFDARDPAYDYASFAERERTVRDAAARWAARGVLIRFGVELTYNRAWEADLRAHLRRHAYDFTIGSVHDWPDSPYVPSRVRTWASGRTLPEVLAPYLEQVTAAARSGLFDTIGHLDVVRRYLNGTYDPAEVSAAVELFEPALRGLVESDTALELNTSGYRREGGFAYPGPALVRRYRELGGERVTAGSDAHRAGHFAWALEAGYRVLADAGFPALAFRRGGDRVALPFPDRLRSPGAIGGGA